MVPSVDRPARRARNPGAALAPPQQMASAVRTVTATIRDESATKRLTVSVHPSAPLPGMLSESKRTDPPTPAPTPTLTVIPTQGHGSSAAAASTSIAASHIELHTCAVAPTLDVLRDDALHEVLDGLHERGEMLLGRYIVQGAAERRAGGQGIVQFAIDSRTSQTRALKVCLFFHTLRALRACERRVRV